MEVLQDVEEAVEEERVVLDELVVLRHLAGHQHPQLRVDRRQPLQLRPKGRHAAAPPDPTTNQPKCRDQELPLVVADSGKAEEEEEAAMVGEVDSGGHL